MTFLTARFFEQTLSKEPSGLWLPLRPRLQPRPCFPIQPISMQGQLNEYMCEVQDQEKENSLSSLPAHPAQASPHSSPTMHRTGSLLSSYCCEVLVEGGRIVMRVGASVREHWKHPKPKEEDKEGSTPCVRRDLRRLRWWEPHPASPVGGEDAMGAYIPQRDQTLPTTQLDGGV